MFHNCTHKLYPQIATTNCTHKWSHKWSHNCSVFIPTFLWGSCSCEVSTEPYPVQYFKNDKQHPNVIFYFLFLVIMVRNRHFRALIMIHILHKNRYFKGFIHFSVLPRPKVTLLILGLWPLPSYVVILPWLKEYTLTKNGQGQSRDMTFLFMNKITILTGDNISTW